VVVCDGTDPLGDTATSPNTTTYNNVPFSTCVAYGGTPCSFMGVGYPVQIFGVTMLGYPTVFSGTTYGHCYNSPTYGPDD